MTEIDRERYTTAMLALGFAVGMIMDLRRRLQDANDWTREEDYEWLAERVGRVMQLNDEVQPPRGDE
jgi:hypothetical protein